MPPESFDRTLHKMLIFDIIRHRELYVKLRFAVAGGIFLLVK